MIFRFQFFDILKNSQSTNTCRTLCNISSFFSNSVSSTIVAPLLLSNYPLDTLATHLNDFSISKFISGDTFISDILSEKKRGFICRRIWSPSSKFRSPKSFKSHLRVTWHQNYIKSIRVKQIVKGKITRSGY